MSMTVKSQVQRDVNNKKGKKVCYSFPLKRRARSVDYIFDEADRSCERDHFSAVVEKNG